MGSSSSTVEGYPQVVVDAPLVVMVASLVGSEEVPLK